MSMLKLADVLEVPSPERERLVEIDDAICDLVRAVEAEAEERERLTVSRAMVGVLVAAAARHARAACPALSEAELAEAFTGLAKEAIDWASRRGLKPARGAPQDGGAAPEADPRSRRPKSRLS
jgi:hypothetical protein